MRLKTFTAASMVKAIAAIRDELGEDAIIVSTEAGRNGRNARVVVAIDDGDSDADAIGHWHDTADGGWEVSAPPAEPDTVRSTLAYHGVPAALAERLRHATAMVAAAEPTQALAAALDGTLAFQPFADRPAQRPVMFVGPPGAGKTLTAARLIVDAQRRGRPVTAISCDTRRAGGCEQLDAFMRILGVPLTMAETPEALAAAIQGDSGSAVFIDSPGANPYDSGEMRELARLVAASGAEPVLVLAAGTDACEAADIGATFARLGCRRLVATRLDISRRLGALLGAADGGRLAFAGASLSPHAADAPSPLTPPSLARLLLSTAPATTLATAPSPAVPDPKDIRR